MDNPQMTGARSYLEHGGPVHSPHWWCGVCVTDKEAESGRWGGLIKQIDRRGQPHPVSVRVSVSEYQ